MSVIIGETPTVVNSHSLNNTVQSGERERKARRRRYERERAALQSAGLLPLPPNKRTHCPHGHEYTDANTYIDKRGWRQCRECNSRQSRQSRKARKAAFDLARLGLTPLAYDAALYLYTNPQRPITHQELVTKAWGRSYIDADSNTLQVHIRHIRVALGDTTLPRRFIVTVPKQRAYMWIGPSESEAA